MDGGKVTPIPPFKVFGGGEGFAGRSVPYHISARFSLKHCILGKAHPPSCEPPPILGEPRFFLIPLSSPCKVSVQKNVKLLTTRHTGTKKCQTAQVPTGSPTTPTPPRMEGLKDFGGKGTLAAHTFPPKSPKKRTTNQNKPAKTESNADSDWNVIIPFHVQTQAELEASL